MASWIETGVGAGLGGGVMRVGSGELIWPEYLFMSIKEEQNEKGFCYTFDPTPLDSESIIKVKPV